MKTYWVRVRDEEFEVAVEEEAGTPVVSVGGTPHRAELAEVVPAWFTLIVDGQTHDLGVWDHAGLRTLMLDGRPCAVEVRRTRPPSAQGQPGRGHRGGGVVAPMPGLLVALHVGEGAQVGMGQPLVIMEAMKMQMEVRAPHDGVIRRVHVTPGQELTAGQLLVTIE